MKLLEPEACRAWSRIPVVLVADDHVERPQPEFGQGVLEFEFGDLDPDLRVVNEHAGHGGDEHTTGGRLQAGGTHPAAHLSGQGRQVRMCGLRCRQQDARVERR